MSLLIAATLHFPSPRPSPPGRGSNTRLLRRYAFAMSEGAAKRSLVQLVRQHWGLSPAVHTFPHFQPDVLHYGMSPGTRPAREWQIAWTETNSRFRWAICYPKGLSLAASSAMLRRQHETPFRSRTEPSASSAKRSVSDSVDEVTPSLQPSLAIPCSFRGRSEHTYNVCTFTT